MLLEETHTCQGVVGDMREMLLIIHNMPPLLVLINYSWFAFLEKWEIMLPQNTSQVAQKTKTRNNNYAHFTSYYC